MATSLLTSLEQGNVRVHYRANDFASAVRGLLEQPLLENGVNPSRVDEIIEGVLRREEAGSTRSGSIALPHARVSGIPDITAGLGINAGGVFGDENARVILAFVSPAEAAGDHLRFLSSAAKTLRNPSFLERVQSATSKEAVLELLRTSGA